MAYIPDEWVMGNLKIAPSTVRLLFYYCGRADQDTGETNVSPQRASQDLGIRKDHVDEHDRKLVRGGLIRIAQSENEGRIIHMLAPWQPRSKRTAQRTGGKATSQVLVKQAEAVTQNLGSPLDGFPKFGEIPQNLGESSQNLGEIPQNLGTHIRNNQLMNQREGEGNTLADEIASALCDLYRVPDTAGWRLKDKFQHLAIELHGVGASVGDVKSFHESRQKKPGVEFFLGDFVAWRASQNGTARDGPTVHYPPIVTAPADYRKPKPKEQGAE